MIGQDYDNALDSVWKYMASPYGPTIKQEQQQLSKNGPLRKY
ncbi:MAG: hypothetical protein ABIP78_05715 [Pyrinomonadaceae bacterium]